MGRWRPHIVRQGDHLGKIAYRYDCDPDEIWNAPKNNALRELRGDGAILFPNDIVWVPVIEPTYQPLDVGELNRYVVDEPEITVRFILEADGQPLANEPYVVLELDPPDGRNSGPDGLVEFDVPVDWEEAKIHLPKRDRTFSIAVGHLDPIQEPSGRVQRLRNLGYLEPEGLVNRAELEEAVQSFQTDSKIEDSEQRDAEIQEALEKAHGS